MASSKVMATTSPPNPDLHSALNLHSDHSRGFESINMDEILRNIYSDSDTFADGGMNGNKTVDEVWREIVHGGAGSAEPGMTLQDFLSKAGNDGAPAAAVGTFGMMNPATAAVHFAPEFGSGMAAGGGGRGKRRAVVEEVPLDKATQQKQRRMIKNRESAARSRERKQAYTVELESLVTHLEEENARLLKEEAELNKKRYKQLMENLIPVAEKRRSPRVLRRVHSMEW